MNDLYSIGVSIENQILIRYALKIFSRSTLWLSMVDACKISTLKLGESFYEFELQSLTLVYRRKVKLSLQIRRLKEPKNQKGRRRRRK